MSQARVQAFGRLRRKSLRSRPRRHLEAKLGLVAFVFVLSAWSREKAQPLPPGAGHEALYQGLERHLPEVTSVRGVAWAPSAGVVGDYLWGRGVLFAGIDQAPAPPSSALYLSCARVLWNGQIINLDAPLELVRKSGGESHLLASGAQAAWVNASDSVGSKPVIELTRLRFPRPLTTCTFGQAVLRAERWLAHVDGRKLRLPGGQVQSASLHRTAGNLTIAFKGESLVVQLGGFEATITPSEDLARALVERIGSAPKGGTGGAEKNSSLYREREPVVREHRELGAASVELISIAAQSLQWRIFPSAQEPAAAARPFRTPDAFEPKVAFSLGTATEGTRFGLASGGLVFLPPRASYATLTLSPSEGFAFRSPGTRPELGENEELVQLPLLIKDGVIADNARGHGGNRYRGGLCLDGRGLLLLAFVHHDSSFPIARLLAEKGCEWAFDLDRGSQHPARYWVDEGQGGLEATGDQTWIVGSSG